MPSRTIVEMFRAQVARSEGRVALRTKRGATWEATTWGEWSRRSALVAGGLVEAGVARGDRVAIFAETREEWVIADLGVLVAGAITVPIYPTLTAEQAAYILRDSAAKVVIVDNRAQLAKILANEAGGVAEALVRIVLLHGEPRPEERPRVITFAELASGAHAAEVDERAAAVVADDLATIVYTSGTTGAPKGVMLTHGNFAFEAAAIAQTLALSSADEQLLFPPLAHIFAKILVVAQIEIGFSTAFAESLSRALENMMEINPTIFGSVPRLYEKIYAVANEKASIEGPLKEKIFHAAIGVGKRVSALAQRGEAAGRFLSVENLYADKLVFQKIRARFGSRLRFAVSGGAPLAKELGEWFAAVGVTILEGYGLTETTAATNVNRPGQVKFGAVGPPLPGVEVKVAADGEVLMRGPNIMRGYYNRPEATAEAIDAEGWFHSGDIGEIDQGGVLRITDRKKDIIVTAGGKNIAPQNIEGRLMQSPWIGQAMVHGDNRKYLVALVALDAEAVGRWAREHGRPDDMATLAHDPEVRALVEIDIDAINRKLAQFETVKRFAILEHMLTIDAGELTPTLKVKRKVIDDRYRATLDALYDGDD